MKGVEEMDVDLRLKEVYVNLKNFDFELHGNYKMDQQEAQKIIDYVEKKGAKHESN